MGSVRSSRTCRRKLPAIGSSSSARAMYSIRSAARSRRGDGTPQLARSCATNADSGDAVEATRGRPRSPIRCAAGVTRRARGGGERFQTGPVGTAHGRTTDATGSGEVADRGNVAAEARRQLGDGAFHGCAHARTIRSSTGISPFSWNAPSARRRRFDGSESPEPCASPWSRWPRFPTTHGSRSPAAPRHGNCPIGTAGLVGVAQRYPPPRGSMASDQHDVNVFAQRRAVHTDHWLARRRLLRTARRLRDHWSLAMSCCCAS